jgi:hypothetical protein
MSEATSINRTGDRRWLILGVIGICACGAVIGGTLLRRGPLSQSRTPSPARGGVRTPQAETSREQVQ